MEIRNNAEAYDNWTIVDESGDSTKEKSIPVESTDGLNEDDGIDESNEDETISPYVPILYSHPLPPTTSSLLAAYQEEISGILCPISQIHCKIGNRNYQLMISDRSDTFNSKLNKLKLVVSNGRK
jgi:hypothetical protein